MFQYGTCVSHCQFIRNACARVKKICQRAKFLYIYFESLNCFKNSFRVDIEIGVNTNEYGRILVYRC